VVKTALLTLIIGHASRPNPKCPAIFNLFEVRCPRQIKCGSLAKVADEISRFWAGNGECVMLYFLDKKPRGEV
jgi:hypothetical protein